MNSKGLCWILLEINELHLDLENSFYRIFQSLIERTVVDAKINGISKNEDMAGERF